MQNNTFSTLFVGQNLIKLSAVDSTNNFLKNLVSNSEPLPEGTVIMADNQFAGRGQQQNTWHADPGKNLTFSILLQPNFLMVGKQFLLNMAVSIAINQALTAYLPNGLSIKWPNDIYYGQLKLGGVLIENAIVGNAIKTAVIGIGINVNQTMFHPDLDHRVVSLARILHEDVNLELLLGNICSHIERMYLRLKSGAHTFLRANYVDKLYRINVLATYRDAEGVFEGVIMGVSDDGLLLLEKNGQQAKYNFKEIEFLNLT